MASVREDEITGVVDRDQLLCMNCFEGSIRNYKREDIIMEGERDEEEILFCDKCGEAI